MIDRELMWNGKRVDFSLMKLLFPKTMNDVLPLCRFLSRRHVDPTNFERMKVAYARAVFKPEVVAALRCMQDRYQSGFQHVQPLTEFLEFFWKCYNYHYICNMTQHYQQRLDIKKPFYDPNNDRLYELDVTIPQMLIQWNQQKTNPMECFTKETLDAIILTSRFTANFIKHLLNNGLHFVLTRRFF
ncbi:Uncharacterized protein APZ42_025079 [Daphnia magna]|uniref:Transposable element P transposase-like GTP-binding insertion domain-containing protein n=1 Tax=Daphnia magna TaxID=35525 RepID=A0A0P6A3P4_9CRUS|nr:Uncharacterized protein APZ42_025079 [Daphnia magna]